MRVVTADDNGVVERPAQNAPFRFFNHQIEGGALADDEFRVEHPPHLLPNAVATNGSDEAQVADVDAQNWNPGAAKPMCRLQQGSITATSDDQIRLFMPQVTEPTVKIALGRQSFHPFLLHSLAVEHGLEGFLGLLGVHFRPVDHDDDFADFHREYAFGLHSEF